MPQVDKLLDRKAKDSVTSTRSSWLAQRQQLLTKWVYEREKWGWGWGVEKERRKEREKGREREQNKLLEARLEGMHSYWEREERQATELEKEIVRGEKKLGSKLLSFIFLLELISVEDKNPYISEKKNLLIKFNAYVILVFLINGTARRPLTLILYAVTVQSKLR